ncbi:MAG: lysophospholipase [Treponema sp.]|nr:lysophospholipase [Treponema sp.]
MQTKSFFFKMSDGIEIAVNRWMPDSEEDIKGLVQLHHGLAEHSMRYDRLGSILADNGWILNAYDMRGHGKTAENAEKKGTGRFGKLAEKDGFNRVVEDLHEMIEGLKNEYQGKKIILLGHSFGSFVSQGYIEKYGKDIDACILCGTAGPNPALIGPGKFMANLVRSIKGENSIVPLLSKLSFGPYNKRVENPSSPNSWLSKNELNVQLYDEDKWCGIPLTTSFFCDMLSGLSQIHKMQNIKAIPNELPVFFIFGGEDPVGSYGESIRKLHKIYQDKGMKKVYIKEYAGDRHEILNEDDKETVEADILGWISNI